MSAPGSSPIDISTYITGAQFLICFFLQTFVLIQTSRTLWHVIKGSAERKQLSPFLIALLVIWMSVSISIIPYLVYAIVLWRPVPGGLRDSYLLFWMGFPVVAPMAVVSIVVTFLTLDRILVVKLLQDYSPQNRKRLFYVFLVVAFVCCILHYVNFLSALRNMTPTTKCITTPCVVGPQTFENYGIARIVVAAINLFLGLTFFILLYRHNYDGQSVNNATNDTPGARQRRTMNKINNQLAMFSVLSEITLGFLNHLFPLLVQVILDVNISAILGPYSLTGASIDAAIYSIIYSRSLMRARKVSNAAWHTTSNSAQNIQLSRRQTHASN
ncbi:serpentine type 7TM GPCR chemoreceptor srbc domain-containing protein [Ditylenchus destructor]|nr:serpentine type 7TM GPCR chemoreceptor srbc domain-containing protein [Ditylenchus destructor]